MKTPPFWPLLAARCRNLHPGVRRKNSLDAPFARVAAASAEVDQAMQGVEAGFLEISSILETTIQIEQNLVAQSRRMVSLAEGPEGGAAIIEQAAAHIWHGIEFAESSDRQVVKFIERLAETSRQIQITLPAQQALTEALTPLKYVQILFRVESASLPPEVQKTFLALNAEISRICERVETGFQEKFELIASIGTRLEQAKSSLTLRQASTRLQLDSLRSQLESSIGSVKADYAKNQARDLRLETIVPQVKRDTGAVVMSLQAQDMLNQKLQHLHTILREITAAHRTMPIDLAGGGRSLRFIEQSGRLVSAQLDVMKAELATAGTQVGGGLAKIIEAMSGLNEDFGVEQSHQAESITIDGGIQNLIEALENVGTLIRASHQLVSETHRTIEPIRGLSTHFTSFMRDLTLDIHLIGLNAEVQSAHVAQGTGLEVVSARATEVSLTTCRLSEQLATDIDRITQGLGELIDSFGQIREQTETFGGELTQQTNGDADRLHHYRDQVVEVLLQIGEQLPLLEAQISTAVSHADFSGAAVVQLEALRAAVGELQSTATATADGAGVSADTTGLLDQFLKGYTMQSQVDVHQRALGLAPTVAAMSGAAAVVAVAGATSGAAGAGGSGEIDLFGFDDLGPAPAAPAAAAASVAAGDIDLWGDDPVVGENPVAAAEPAGAAVGGTGAAAAPARAASGAAAMDVELWGDDEGVTAASPADPQRSAA